MADLPDWFTQIQSATLRATSIAGGIDADKSASPVAEDVYLARDTGILYVCFTSGTWKDVGYLETAARIAADSAEAIARLAVDARLDDVTWSEPTRALNTEYQNTTGKLKLVTLTVDLEISGSIDLDGDSDVQFYIGSTSPAGTEVARARINASDIVGGSANAKMESHQAVTFLVPINWYYRTAPSNALDGQAPVLADWHEWDLL